MTRVTLRSFVFLSLVLGATIGYSRTIELTDLDCHRMAMISPNSSRSSWAMFEWAGGEFATFYVELRADYSFLACFPLDRIPPGQRITRAEWILPVALSLPAGEQRVYVRRIVSEWGAGVCHDYRMQRPKKIPWAAPGATGVGTDRAAQPTAVARANGAGELAINVTEDVELWYTGAAENHGWIMAVEDSGTLVRVNSTFWQGYGLMKLRITYEPE